MSQMTKELERSVSPATVESETPNLTGRRIVFVQHGDFAEATDRFDAGQGELYYAQRHSTQVVVDLARCAERVSVICVSAGPYDRSLSNGVRALGVPVDAPDALIARSGELKLLRTLEVMEPTDLILRTPMVRVLAWGLRRGVRTLPMLADSFRPGLGRWLQHRRLATLLNSPRVEWIGNHNINSARSLESIGVDAAKIVPWDWPMAGRPEDNPAKLLPSGPGSRRLIFVGAHTAPKGLPDVIHAVAALRRDGLNVTLTSIGGGELDSMRRLADRLGIGEHVTFTGRVEHGRAVRLMREHDIVVVPSRHDYPEGLPMTIYDALVSRTPLIVSDHPMFAGKVRDGESGLVFHAADPADLARPVRALLSDSDLYARLSLNAAEAFRRIECPAKWAQVVRRWLRNDEEDRRWLASYALSAGGYA